MVFSVSEQNEKLSARRLRAGPCPSRNLPSIVCQYGSLDFTCQQTNRRSQRFDVKTMPPMTVDPYFWIFAEKDWLREEKISSAAGITRRFAPGEIHLGVLMRAPAAAAGAALDPVAVIGADVRCAGGGVYGPNGVGALYFLM